MRIVGRHFATGEPVAIETLGDRVAAVRPATSSAVGDAWIAPGLIDIQVNGGGGHEFSSVSLTTLQVAEIARSQARSGVARFCPTITTGAEEALAHGARTIAEACEAFPDAARRIAGIHVEGPFISREDGPRGAHPLAHVREPNWSEFERLQSAAGGRIRMITLSPEYDSAPNFIAKAVASGVRVAIGHTAANADQIRAAVDAGASLSTHLGNGCHGTLRRHPNYLWDQLAEDRLFTSLIVDGHHLPPAVVKSFVRAKTPDRIVLVSDLSALAGMPPGRYMTGLCELDVLESGKLVVAGQEQMLAAAGEPIGTGVVNVMRFAGVDLATAIAMASSRPAEWIGVECGRLEVGGLADLVVLRLPPEGAAKARPEILQTIIAGEVAYSAA